MFPIWPSLHIDWLVSIWWEHWSFKGQQWRQQKEFSEVVLVSQLFNIEHVSHIFLVFLLLALNRLIFAGLTDTYIIRTLAFNSSCLLTLNGFLLTLYGYFYQLPIKHSGVIRNIVYARVSSKDKIVDLATLSNQNQG